MNSSERIRSAIGLARVGKKDEARDILLSVVEYDQQNELAWIWLVELVDSTEDQIVACENILSINPKNEDAHAFLSRLKEIQLNKLDIGVWHDGEKNTIKVHKADPLDDAKYLEMDGKYEDAMRIYTVAAAQAKHTHSFNEIYKRLSRIERLLDEGVRYVRPNSSIARLTFVWPLVYVSFGLVQAGLFPIQTSAAYIWLGLPWVVIGSYLLAVSEVRSRHLIWRSLFREQDDGSELSRWIVGGVAWLMILIPLLVMFVDSLNRYKVFEIPPRPF